VREEDGGDAAGGFLEDGEQERRGGGGGAVAYSYACGWVSWWGLGVEELRSASDGGQIGR
jgi:hypothetical protein